MGDNIRTLINTETPVAYAHSLGRKPALKHPLSGAARTLRHATRSRQLTTPTFLSPGRSWLWCALLTLLTACGGGESNVVSGNRDGVLHYGNGTEPQGLDPHVVTGVPENHIIRALFEGLAVKNPITLEPEPGVAERWEFSDEGRVITFYLNPEAQVVQR